MQLHAVDRGRCSEFVFRPYSRRCGSNDCGWIILATIRNGSVLAYFPQVDQPHDFGDRQCIADLSDFKHIVSAIVDIRPAKPTLP